MNNKKEPRCPECDSTCLLTRYFYDYTRCQIYCGHCYAESDIRNTEVEERACREWGVGKAKMDKWKKEWKKAL